MIRFARVSPSRLAASDDRFPGVVGYGETREEAQRALEEKLPARPPPLPPAPLLPLSPAHGIYARDRETPERTRDALDRAIRVGSFEGNRRRH